MQIRAAAMREVPMLATDSYDQLDEVTLRQHAFANLDQWRQEAGADLVAVFTPRTETAVCGIAWLATSRNTAGQFQFSSQYLVSLTHITCSDYVLAHEAGHNMGLVHSEKQGNIGVTFPFARGYGVDNHFATVMAYEGVFNGQKIYQFSNPDLLCNGMPCGVERHAPNGADASYAINAVRFALQDLIRKEPTPLTFENAITQIKDLGLKGCLQSIRNNRPDLYYASQLTSLLTFQNADYCSSANPITSLDGLSLFTNITDIDLSYHQVTDFSELGQLRRLQKLKLSSAAPIQLDWLQHLSELNSFTVNNTDVVDLTPLTTLQQLRILELTNVSVASFAPIQQLNQLRELTLQPNISSSDRLTDAAWLNRLTELTKLILMSTQLGDTKMTSNMAKLQVLTLGSSQQLKIDGLHLLANLSLLNLTSSSQLDCHSTYQTWLVMPQLTRLRLPAHCKSDDVTAPVFDPLPEIVVEATAKRTPYQLVAPIAKDNSDGNIVAKTLSSSVDYPVGRHQIWWTATDFNGNSKSAEQILTIRDTTAPQLNGPDEAGIFTYNPQGVFRYSFELSDLIKQFSASDKVDGVLNITYPDQPYWELGVHQFPLTATDSSGNATTRHVLLLVNYHYGPVFTAPAQVTLPSPSLAGLSATSEQIQLIIQQIKASDYFNNQQLAVTADPPTQLLPGKNMIIFSAVDGSGYKNSYLLPVMLTDQQAPTLTVPTTLKLTANSHGISKNDPRILQFLQNARARDNFDPDTGSQVVISYQLPERFLPGITAIVFTATDRSGNQATANGFIDVALKKRQNRLLQLMMMAPKQKQ